MHLKKQSFFLLTSLLLFLLEFNLLFHAIKSNFFHTPKLIFTFFLFKFNFQIQIITSLAEFCLIFFSLTAIRVFFLKLLLIKKIYVRKETEKINSRNTEKYTQNWTWQRNIYDWNKPSKPNTEYRRKKNWVYNNNSSNEIWKWNEK